MRIVSRGLTDHLIADLRREHLLRSLILEIGMPGRHQQHFIQVKSIIGRLCYDQMGRMNGIKGSAQDPHLSAGRASVFDLAKS